MNCTSCGNPLPSDARFCTRCGTVRVFTPQSFFSDRVARHLPSLGAIWLVYAVLRMTKSFIGLAFLHHFFDRHTFGFFPVWPFAAFSLGIGVIGALITGFALLTRQPWGRVVAIISAILALCHPIIGTVLGIYTLWVLAPQESGPAYYRETLHRRPF